MRRPTPLAEAAMRPSRILVVIPTFNEALNLDEVVSRVLAAGPEFDVLVVDDGSPDGTAALAMALAARDSRVRVVERAGKEGRGTAVLAGFRHGLSDSAYGLFAEMDADLSHAPEALPELVAAAAGYDVVIGSRYIPGATIVGWDRKRTIWSATANRLLGAAMRLRVSDYTNGFRLYRRAAVEELVRTELRESGFIALSEFLLVLARADYSITEVPVTFRDRSRGKSNMAASEVVGALRALPRLWRLARS